MTDAYAPIDTTAKTIEIADEQGRAWWVKNFKAKWSVPTKDFEGPMQERFPGNEKVVRVLSQFVICCSSGKQTVDVTADNFDTFLKRFGPFNDCVDKAQKVFFFG